MEVLFDGNKIRCFFISCKAKECLLSSSLVIPCLTPKISGKFSWERVNQDLKCWFEKVGCSSFCVKRKFELSLRAEGDYFRAMRSDLYEDLGGKFLLRAFTFCSSSTAEVTKNALCFILIKKI